MARLCILREDFLLELYGITNDQIERLDDNHGAYRRNYFWRNSLRTLEEIRGVMNGLGSETTFRVAMEKDAEVRVAFEDAKRALNKASEEFLVFLRNKVGAHVDEAWIQTALNSMDPQQEGYIQVGEMTGETHYKFALEVLWSALLHDVPKEAALEEIESLLEKSARLTSAIGAIDKVVFSYFKDRKLP